MPKATTSSSKKKTSVRKKDTPGSLVKALCEPGSRESIPRPVLVARVREGLPSSELVELQKALGVSEARLADLLGLSRATLKRRKASKRLDELLSDRVVRFARLFGWTVEVIEDLDHARSWLDGPQYGLGYQIPLDYAKTELGGQEVWDLLGRIEYGVLA